MKRYNLIGPCFFILIWYGVWFLKIVNPIFLPSMHRVMQSIVALMVQDRTWLDILSTTWKTIVSFTIAALIGIPIGLFMGYYKSIYNMFSLLVDFSRSLPAISLFPLFMFFFGIGNSSKIATAVFTGMLIVIINSCSGVNNTKKTLSLYATIMGANKYEIFRYVLLMEALPYIFVGLRICLSYTIIVIIATEMFIGNSGIGNRIYQAQLTFNASDMYAFIFIAGILGYLFNSAFVKLEKKVVHWSGK